MQSIAEISEPALDEIREELSNKTRLCSITAYVERSADTRPRIRVLAGNCDLHICYDSHPLLGERFSLLDSTTGHTMWYGKVEMSQLSRTQVVCLTIALLLQCS